MKFGYDAKTVSIVGAAAFAALLLASPSAAADPVAPPLPVPAPAPGPLPDAPVLPGPVLPGPDAAAATLAAGPVDAVDPVPVAVPHLASPDNLPPGTIISPTTPNQPRLTYIRDLWHAMQTEDVSGSDALLLLAQRPMSSMPQAGQAAGPQAPLAAPLPAGPQAPLPVAPLPVDPPAATP